MQNTIPRYYIHIKNQEETDKENYEIGKEPDSTNPEDLLEYIQPFTHLFNKKKLKKLLEIRE